MPVATLAELKKQLNRADDRDDVELQFYLDAATEVVESIIDGPTEVRTLTETHTPGSGGVIVPRKRPVVAVTSLTLDGSPTPLDPASYTVESGVITLDYARWGGYRVEYPHTRRYILVYQVGYATVLAAHRLAGLIIAQHLWRTQNGGSGGRVLPGDDVAMVPGLAFAIPNRALELLTGGMLPAVG